MSSLKEENLRKVKWLLYDDMCHLGMALDLVNRLNFKCVFPGPFSQRKENVQNPIGKFFASRHLAVDFLHFLNHKVSCLWVTLGIQIFCRTAVVRKYSIHM